MVTAAKCAVELDKLDPGFRRNLAGARYRTGDVDGAVDDLKRTLLLDEADDQARCDLGFVAFRRHDLDRAIDYLETVTNHDPRSARAHSNLGLVYRLKDPSDARIERAFRMATSFDPGRADAWCGLAIDLHAHGKCPDALDAAATAVEVATRKSFGYVLVAALLHSEASPDARERFERGLDVWSEEPDGPFLDADRMETRAVLLLGGGRRGEAIECLEEAIAVLPRGFHLYCADVGIYHILAQGPDLDGWPEFLSNAVTAVGGG